MKVKKATQMRIFEATAAASKAADDLCALLRQMQQVDPNFARVREEVRDLSGRANTLAEEAAGLKADVDALVVKAFDVKIPFACDMDDADYEEQQKKQRLACILGGGRR